MTQQKGKKRKKVTSKKVKQKPLFVVKNAKYIFAAILGVFVLFGILLFDPSINPMSDDALFLVQSYNFIQKGTYPTQSGVLYSLALCIPMLMVGLKFIYFKGLSFLFGIVGFYFFYKFFKTTKAHYLIALFGVLLFHAFNWRIQYYHSSVMTESFFMMAQMICLYLIYPRMQQVFSADYSSIDKVKSDWKQWVWIAILLLVLSMAKNVTIIASMAVAVYFLCYGKWKHSGLTILSFGIVKLIYDTILSQIFNVGASGQWATIKYKNYYNKGEGEEDLSGFVSRLFENYNHHISVDFYKTIGWRSDSSGSLDTSVLLSSIFAVVFLLVLWHFYKTNKKFFFIGLYLGAVQAAIYLALQTHWKQDRMVLAYMPLILIFLFTGLADVLKKYASGYHLKALAGSLLILVLISTSGLLNRINANQNKLSGFLSGDLYSGYTPDWQNYLKMADWADSNLDKTSKVAVRKPETSQIFSSNNISFYGLFRSTQESGDKVLEDFKNRNITHIQLCNIRLNPAQAVEGQILGTTYSYARSIENFKQGTLQGVHKIGDTEPCTLYAIKYE